MVFLRFFGHPPELSGLNYVADSENMHLYMELKSNQRSFLIKKAQTIKPVVYVGKAGVGEAVSQSLTEALEHHELVKVRFIVFKPEKKELALQLAADTGSQIVRVIGNVAILFKEQPDPEKRKYQLPAAK